MNGGSFQSFSSPRTATTVRGAGAVRAGAAAFLLKPRRLNIELESDRHFGFFTRWNQRTRGVRDQLSLSVRSRGATRGQSSSPHGCSNASILLGFQAAELTESPLALPVLWKYLILLSGRHGLEPWTR